MAILFPLLLKRGEEASNHWFSSGIVFRFSSRGQLSPWSSPFYFWWWDWRSVYLWPWVRSTGEEELVFSARPMSSFSDPSRLWFYFSFFSSAHPSWDLTFPPFFPPFLPWVFALLLTNHRSSGELFSPSVRVR